MWRGQQATSRGAMWEGRGSLVYPHIVHRVASKILPELCDGRTTRHEHVFPCSPTGVQRTTGRTVHSAFRLGEQAQAMLPAGPFSLSGKTHLGRVVKETLTDDGALPVVNEPCADKSPADNEELLTSFVLRTMHSRSVNPEPSETTARALLVVRCPCSLIAT